MKVMKKTIYFTLMALALTSCWDWKKLPPMPSPPTVKVLGYVPIYTNDPIVYKIFTDTVRPMKNAGKIYVKDNLIFQNDLGYGIHVFDKSNPSHPTEIGFINLRGNLEMSIKGNMLYANSYQDLVVVDISDWRNLKELQRIKNAFSQGYEANQMTPYLFVPPPERGFYFECPDITKGTITSWKKDSVYTNNCFYHL